MKNSSFTILLCSFSFSAIAQTTFNINNYKYRVDRFRYSTYSFNSTNRGDYSRQNSWYPEYKQSNYWLESSSYAGSLNVNYSFYSFINREKLQRIVRVNLPFDLSYNSRSNRAARVDFKAKDIAGNISSTASIVQRNYNGNKFKLFSAWLYLPMNYSNGKSNNIQQSKYAAHSLGNIVDISIGFGTGRLENISDAAFASFWLEDMKIKSIIGNYTAAQLENLAKTITKVRNTRIIDFRFRTIGQLKMYDSFFKESGLVEKMDIAYFSTLYDHYLYANNFSRFSGKQKTWYSKVTENTSNSKRNSKIDSYIDNIHSTNLTMEYGIGFNVVNDRAKSLHKQRTKSMDVFAYAQNSGSKYKERYGDTQITDAKINENTTTANLSISQTRSWGYYFNTRNFLTVHLQYRIIGTIDKKNNYQISPFVQGALQYFHWFSPNLKLTVNSYITATNQVNHLQKTQGTIETFSQNTRIQPFFQIGLNYTVF